MYPQEIKLLLRKRKAKGSPMKKASDNFFLSTPYLFQTAKKKILIKQSKK